MCQEITYDIHLCRDDERPFACELAAMEDFEGIHSDYNITRHQDLKNWESFYHVASLSIDECTTIVATEGEKVIGLVNFMCTAYGTINYLYVLPEWRHQGIGKALLKNAEKHIASASIPFSRVLVNSYEDTAIEFYKKMGYSTRQVIMKKSIRPIVDNTLEHYSSSLNECDENVMQLGERPLHRSDEAKV